MLGKEDNFTRQKIEGYARDNKVCPFELSLDLSLWCDIIRCDYNYAVDPRAKLKRFFEEDVKINYFWMKVTILWIELGICLVQNSIRVR